MPNTIKDTLGKILKLIKNNKITDKVFIYGYRFNYRTRFKNRLSVKNATNTIKHMKSRAKKFIPLAVVFIFYYRMLLLLLKIHGIGIFSLHLLLEDHFMMDFY